MTAGLRRVLDKRPAYEGLLRKFVAGQAHAVQATRTALAAGQHDEAQRAMHTLKGTAGTIGATALAALAQRAEEAIAQKASPELVEPLLQPVEAACQALVAALQQALPADKKDNGKDDQRHETGRHDEKVPSAPIIEQPALMSATWPVCSEPAHICCLFHNV